MKFIFYTSLNQNKIVANINKLREHKNKDLYYETLAMLLEESYINHLGRNLFKMYLCYLIAQDENPFSLSAEKEGRAMDEKLKALAIHDMAILIELFQLQIIEEELSYEDDESFYNTIYEFLENNASPKELLEALAGFYHYFGAGTMNRYRAFKWDTKEGLIGITQCDPIRLETLIGCDYQKEVLIKNTENFLKGKACNNVLLFGDSGTGKSSCVKALLNQYAKEGLRIIDLSKADFLHFNKILSKLKGRGLKFIVFLDDLSFEEFETEYKYMKALIEGGVEIKPDNVMIYATSNRRHLIRETWNERQGEEVHIADTQQEKLSLADRFGIALTFTSPNQEAYLKIVLELANEQGIDLPEHVLRERAIKWELVHGGRSGRVAKQFINSLI